MLRWGKFYENLIDLLLLEDRDYSRQNLLFFQPIMVAFIVNYYFPFPMMGNETGWESYLIMKPWVFF